MDGTLAIDITGDTSAKANTAPVVDLSTVEALIYDLTVNGLSAAGNLSRAIDAHFQAGGRRIRASMALQASRQLDLGDETAVALAACCELLHNASLVHDDIQDRDRERRGRPSLWAVHGTEQAICAGDVMLSAAFGALARAKPSALVGNLITLAHGAVHRTAEGQCLDLEQRGHALSDFTVYSRIAGQKSGPLLALPLQLCLTAAERSTELEILDFAAQSIALAYQLIDDLGDVERDQAEGTLNGVSVLQRASGRNGQACRQEAREIVLSELAMARHCATRLYNGSGEPLIGLADRLERKLGELSDAL